MKLKKFENFENDSAPFKYGEYMIFEKDQKFILTYVIPKNKGGDIIVGDYGIYASCSHRTFNDSGDIQYSYTGIEYMIDEQIYLLSGYRTPDGTLHGVLELLWRGFSEKKALEMIESLKMSKKYNL